MPFILKRIWLIALYFLLNGNLNNIVISYVIQQTHIQIFIHALSHSLRAARCAQNQKDVVLSPYHY